MYSFKLILALDISLILLSSLSPLLSATEAVSPPPPFPFYFFGKKISPRSVRDPAGSLCSPDDALSLFSLPPFLAPGAAFADSGPRPVLVRMKELNLGRVPVRTSFRPRTSFLSRARRLMFSVPSAPHTTRDLSNCPRSRLRIFPLPPP